MKRASSPPSSMRANQYSAASGSEPRIDLMQRAHLVVVGVGALVQQAPGPGPLHHGRR